MFIELRKRLNRFWFNCLKIDFGACEPDYMECSACGWITEFYGGLEEEWNYCPRCGAKMDEVEDESHKV